MKGRIIALILAVAMSVLALSSCDILQGGECEHTFSKNWNSSETEHWHPATCEHAEIKDSLAAHSDDDEDGLCDVCEYELGHDHTFASEWTTDEYKHWKEATCSHTDAKGEENLHKDDNTDGVCEVCEAHVHTLDGAGFCTGCGKEVQPVDETDILSLIEAIAIRGGLVKSGKVEYDVIIRSVTEREGDEPYSELAEWHDVEYVFGTNGTYLKRFEDEIITIGVYPSAYTELTRNTLITEYWIPIVPGADNFSGVVAGSVNGEYLTASPSAFGPDNNLGYYFAVSTFADGYGAENVLYAMIEAAHSEAASDLEITHDADANKYVMSFGYLAVNVSLVGEELVYNVNYFEVELDFTYSDDYAITSMNIKCDCYTNDPGTGDGVGFYADDVDFVYDPESGTISLRVDEEGNEIPMVPHTYTFSVSQTVGDREEIVMMEYDDFMPDGFEIYKDETLTEIADSVEITVGDNSVVIYLGAIGDGFVEFLREQLEVVVLDADGNETYGLQATLTGMQVYLVPVIGGEYTVKVTAFGEEKSFAVTVKEIVLSGEFSFEVKNTDNNTWVDYYIFTATASGKHTFYIPANLGIWRTTETELDENGELVPVLDFTGTYPMIDSGSLSYNGSEPHTIELNLRKGQTFMFFIQYPVKNTTHTIYYDIG